jgi:hypothetical protein
VCLLTAETHGARIVVPAQTKVIHPPDLRLIVNRDVNTDESQIGELVVEIDQGELAVARSNISASRNSLCLGRDQNLVAGRVKLVSSEGKITRSASRVATHGCPIHVEAEAASLITITIGNLTIVSFLSSVRTSLCVRSVDIEVGNELEEERWGRWIIWDSGRRNDGETIREVELMVWIEDWLRLNAALTLVADRQGRDIIKLCEISILKRDGSR